MKKEFSDDKIREMREILTSYEEGYLEGAWENFNSMRKRRRLIYRFVATGIAASLIIGILGVSEFLKPTESTHLVATEQHISTTEQHITTEQQIPATEPVVQGSAASGTSTQKLLVTRAVTKTGKETVTEQVSNLIAEQVTEVAKEIKITEVTEITEAVKETALEVVKESAKETTQETAIEVEKEAAKELYSKIALNQGFDLDKPTAKSTKTPADKRVRFGVGFSPGFSATPSSANFNYSGGVSVDIKIARNIQISTGIQIEHQNVSSRSSVRAMGTPAYIDGVLTPTYLPPSNVSALITNFDVPLNIKWNFANSRKSGYYVAAGISSLAYLKETYKTTTYRQVVREKTVFEAGEEITTLGLENVPSTRTNTVYQSDSPDIAGRFNLIFGIEQRISPVLKLHIEPFMKIPLTGLATEELMFTTGGVTFKVSF